MKIVLASASPRRAELLAQMGLDFRVAPSHLEEGLPVFPWEEWVQDLAVRKALAADALFGELVLAADTIVVCGDQVLGKPADEGEAEKMLRLLSGRSHQVITGLCAFKTDCGQVFREAEITRVFFRSLSPLEIKNYVSGGEPLDKAGAYGIQGLGGLFVEKIEGCYYNVVGLPLVKTMRLLRRCGVKVLGEVGDEEREASQVD